MSCKKLIPKYHLSIYFLVTIQAPSVAIQLPKKGSCEMEITTQELLSLSVEVGSRVYLAEGESGL